MLKTSEPIITFPELKLMLVREGDVLEELVKRDPGKCWYGFNVYLPQSCRPVRNVLKFAFYAGRYLLFFESDVQYYGANPYLEALCRSGSLSFCDWNDVTDFCLMLPEEF